MNIVSLVWGILSIVGLFIGIVPCFGWFNWFNIPFSIGGLVLSVVALSKAAPSEKGAATAGLVMCAIAIVLGTIRWFMGGLFF
ncbi:MAG: hypothetical protein ABI811_17445 [Acidobacteriota bacterium]